MVAVLVTAACGQSGAGIYAEKLRKAGFDHVSVTRDMEKVGAKKKLVAYDFDWRVNTDADPAACVVELEYPANPSGGLSGAHWHIDEVNDRDVSGWSNTSPDAATVRRLLGEHGIDC